jgi:hypothetical protein
VAASINALEERGFESVWAPEHSHIPLSRKTPFPGFLRFSGVRHPSQCTVGRSGDQYRYRDVPKREFATDSPLEGDGFEPSVPVKREHGFRECLLDLTRLTTSARETDGSKPYPSASESVCR